MENAKYKKPAMYQPKLQVVSCTLLPIYNVKLSDVILDAMSLLMTVLQNHLGTRPLNHVFIQQQNMLGLNAKQHGHVNHLNHAQSSRNHDIILKGHCAHSPRIIRTAFTAPQLVKKFPTFFFTVLTTAHQ